MSEILIKNVTIADGSKVDIQIQDDRINAVGPNLASEGETIDCSGLMALPGFVDLHTHLREPGTENAETVLTGSQSAVRGGYTAVSAMPNTNPVADTAGVV